MLPVRRSVLRHTRRIRIQGQRRFESSHGETHAEPVNESLGNKFFLTLVLIPTGAYVYSATSGDEQYPSWLTRTIAKYSEAKEDVIRRNALHTKMVEQAAYDRNLFHNADGAKNISLSFPEAFNSYSPVAQHAGHQADLRELIKHYEDEHKKLDEEMASNK